MQQGVPAGDRLQNEFHKTRACIETSTAPAASLLQAGQSSNRGPGQGSGTGLHTLGGEGNIHLKGHPDIFSWTIDAAAGYRLKSPGSSSNKCKPLQ